MGMKINKPAFFHFPELAPLHGIGGIRDGGRIQEERNRNPILLYQRKKIRESGYVAVIHRDHQRMGRGRETSFEISMNELAEGKDLIAVFLNPF